MTDNFKALLDKIPETIRISKDALNFIAADGFIAGALNWKIGPEKMMAEAREKHDWEPAGDWAEVWDVVFDRLIEKMIDEAPNVIDYNNPDKRYGRAFPPKIRQYLLEVTEATGAVSGDSYGAPGKTIYLG